MKTLAADLLTLVGASGSAKKALDELGFIPPLRVLQLRRPPDPDLVVEEPLVYLIGQCEEFLGPGALIEWMDRLREADGPPVALLLPRDGYDWCTATTHPQFCGLLPTQPQIPIQAMERILHEARQNLARRWGQGAVRRARLAWSFTTREAADPEQAWLLLESVLDGVVGASTDLSCLGMAFAEALTNAVEHGNLELKSTLKDGADDGLIQFFEERERRLADPHFGQRRIQVSVDLRGSQVRVRIHNQGRGFNPAELDSPSFQANPSARHGLGLTMIESLVDRVVIAPDGRTATIFHRITRAGHHLDATMALPSDEGKSRRDAA
jgi:anti-sigma regulatory factor (Ser/Thr protein kinase)